MHFRSSLRLRRLVIRGTDSSDVIQVEPGPGAAGIQVKLNGVKFRFTGVSAIFIYTNAGDDVVKLARGFLQPVTIVNGSGPDRVRGGGGGVRFVAAGIWILDPSAADPPGHLGANCSLPSPKR